MTSRNFRVAIVVLIILTFIAFARAQPGSMAYDRMDIDDLDRNPFNDALASLANGEMSRMARTDHLETYVGGFSYDQQTAAPPYAYVDPSQLSRPDASPAEPAYRHSSLEAGKRLDTRGAHTYAAVVRHGTPLSTTEQRPNNTSQHQQQAPNEAIVQTVPQQQDLSLTSSTRHMPVSLPIRTSTKSYADALRSPPFNGHGQPSTAGTLQPTGPLPDDHGSNRTQTMQRLLPESITSNPNFHAGVSEQALTLPAWAAQTGTARGWLGAMPPLNTNLLTPVTPATSRSPASATSPSSSRLSTRRTKKQLLLGNHPHRCHVCDAGYSSPSDLKHHMRTHIPDEERPHECSVCHKRFMYPKDVARHNAVHQPKAFFCPRKGCKSATRGFSRQDHLDRHAQSHRAVDSAQPSSRTPSSAF